MGTMVAGSACWKMYNEDCTDDDELKSQDNMWKSRTESIYTGMVKSKYLPMDSLKEAITFVYDLNETKAKALLECRDKIQKMKKGKTKKKNEEFYQIVVHEYYNNSSMMLDFCSELDRFLTAAWDSHSYIEHVIQQLEKEKTHADHDIMSYVKTVSEKLERLKGSDAFNDHSTSAGGLLKKIEGMHKQQSEMVAKLKVELEKLHKKRNHANFWKTVTKTILHGTTVAGFVCVIVTAAILDPSYIAVALSTFPAVILTVDNWIDCLWKECDNAFHAQKDQISKMNKGTHIANKELGEIKDIIIRFNTQINSIMGTVKRASEGTVDLDFTLKIIKEKLATFSQEIKDLDGKTKSCRAEIKKARDEVLASI